MFEDDLRKVRGNGEDAAPDSDRSAASDLEVCGEAGLSPSGEVSSRKVVMRDLSDLKSDPRNARRHDKTQIQRLAKSLKEFGFIMPVLIDGGGTIVAGHGRIAAAKQLGISKVPTLAVTHLTDAQRRAFAIADNRLAELAHWDNQALASELSALSSLGLSFDCETIGFDTAQIDLLIENFGEAGDDPDDRQPELPPDYRPVTQPGDLWILGSHKLYCGNALENHAYEKLLGGERAQMVFTDPPFNVKIQGHVSGRGAVKHEDFVMASGEMSGEAFAKFLGKAFELLAANSGDGAIHFIVMDWRHQWELLAASRQIYGPPINLCVWNKDNAGMGSLYRSKHELVFVFAVGTASHINNVALGKHGRNRTNVWSYPGGSGFRAGRAEELAMHPTVKPVAMIADAIRDVSRRGGIVLDSFAGSGTTIIAATRTGRIARAMELDPKYVDVAVRRWQLFTGKEATHAETGLSFEEVADIRSGGAKPGTHREDEDRDDR